MNARTFSRPICAMARVTTALRILTARRIATRVHGAAFPRIVVLLRIATGPLATTALLVMPAAVQAQVSALGMAGAYTLHARGVEAPSWNPATLAWGGGTGIRFFSIQGSAGNNSLSLDDYNRWVGTTWSDADKREILSRFRGATLDGFLTASAEGPGVARGGWAFTTDTRAAGDVRVPRELARLVLFGNNPDESFTASGSEGGAFAWSEVRVSHARALGASPLPELPWIGRFYRGDSLAFAAGATLKYLHGWGYAELRRADGGLETTIDAITGEVVLEGVTAEGGTGFGLDLGIAGRSPRGWAVSLDVHNLISSLSWTNHPMLHRESAWADGVTLSDMDEGSDLVTEETVRERTSSFRRSLPALLTFAAAREWRATRVELDWRQGFSDRPGSSRRPRLGAGASYALRPWLETRAGGSLGGVENRSAAMGLSFGLGRVRLDLALASVGSWNFFAPKGVGGGVALGWR